MKNRYKIILLVLLIFLVIGNPSQSQFLTAVKEDFASNHHGTAIGTDMLKSMGNYTHKTYLLFGTFEYSFGNISVKYLGVGFMTFYLGNKVTPAPDYIPEDDVQRS